MKISINKNVLTQYFDTRKDNELADELLNEIYFGLSTDDTKQIKRYHNYQNFSLPKSFKKHINSFLDEESKSAFSFIYENGFGLEDIQILDRKKYENNPYYKLLTKIKNYKVGNIEFKQNKVPEYVPVAVNEKLHDKTNFYREKTPIGIFKEDFYFPAIIQNETTWMSFAPHETETSEEAINRASGHVVTFGCGLGYYPYMVSQKENVKTMTIIEFDPKIIKFFEENLLPLFPHKEKIKIIHADAVKFAKECKEPYDFLFADIWHDVYDGLPFYLIFKKNEHVAKECTYWIEKDMLTYFRRVVLSLIEEESLGYTDKDYAVQDTFLDRLLSTLHYHLKDKVIKNVAELNDFLSDDGLKALIIELPHVKLDFEMNR